ncbi:hypothetical protein GCM10023186_06540 [Hymenobacter koreensis]|uniref:N-acetyltransferase domain-containing protein n=1 Tax=Hymenobacter koreensis TaxID=1084523 RepID=A0ABP8IV01_9BACT
MQAELAVPCALSAYLNADLPDDWPLGDYDLDSARYFLEKLETGGSEAAGWYGWYALHGSTPPKLVGCGGYCGPPDASGTVEIGYSIAKQWQGQGFATEFVRALLARVAWHPSVRRIVAHTHPDNTTSMAVLRRTGFRQTLPTDHEAECWFEYPLN